MDDFGRSFEDRLLEIDTYLDLLDSLDHQVQSGVPRLGVNGSVVTAKQQRILYSSVYLQLYNLVEATISLCIDALVQAIESRDSRPRELSSELLGEWVRSTARTHTDINVEKRLRATLGLCDYLINNRPVARFDLQKGGGGNWDDNAIEKITRRLGMHLQLSPAVKEEIKRPFRNYQGALVFIKNLRNELAHGTVSFAESSEGMTPGDLRDLKARTACYLREVVNSFKTFIDDHGFLAPSYRPDGARA